MAPAKRLLIFAKSPLFSKGVQKLLGECPGLGEIYQETDPAQAIRRVRDEHIDIVVIVNPVALPPTRPALHEFIAELGETRIIEINDQENLVYEYTARQHTITCSDDLLGLILPPA